MTTAEDGGLERPGDWCFDSRPAGSSAFIDEQHRILYIWLPGSSGPDALRVTTSKTEPATDARLWWWDGNEEAPTLDPSIAPPGWHGYLRAGRLESC